MFGVHMGCHGASPGVLVNTQGYPLVLTRVRACEGMCVPWIDMGRIGVPLAEREMVQANGVGVLPLFENGGVPGHGHHDH